MPVIRKKILKAARGKKACYSAKEQRKVRMTLEFSKNYASQKSGTSVK